jgi:hypothetical protein
VRLTIDHTHTYTRLALGYSSVLIALYLFYLDYYLKIPFRLHKVTAAWCGLSYFILNGALTLWIWQVERGMVFAGTRKNGSGLKCYSLNPKRKYEPQYRMLVEWTDASGKRGSKEVVGEFVKFFQEDGVFAPARFEEWVRQVVPGLQGEKSEVGGDGLAGVATGVDIGGNGSVKRKS